jgi:CRISPR-associated endonuclease Cas1
LYGQIERAIVLAGLDPYAGFMHVDRPGKPSLTLDLIEEFRQPVVDRSVIGLINKGVKLEQDERGRFTKETAKMLATRILDRLRANRMSRRSIRCGHPAAGAAPNDVLRNRRLGIPFVAHGEPTSGY